jgi:hypothetical protein
MACQRPSRLDEESKFAQDSSLEEAGFEPSVPLVETGRLCRTGGSKIDVSLTGDRGFESCSLTGESGANLTQGGKGAINWTPAESIGVDPACARPARKVAPRMHALSVLAVNISDGRRHRPSPWPVVPGIGPRPPGLGAAAPGIEHRHRCVVGEDLGR